MRCKAWYKRICPTGYSIPYYTCGHDDRFDRNALSIPECVGHFVKRFYGHHQGRGDDLAETIYVEKLRNYISI